MCTNINHKDLITVHHEMAHVQYFLSYRHQPKVFRDGANSGENKSSNCISLFVLTVTMVRFYFLYTLPYSKHLFCATLPTIASHFN